MKKGPGADRAQGRGVLLKPAADAFKWLISLGPIVNAMARNAHYASPGRRGQRRAVAVALDSVQQAGEQMKLRAMHKMQMKCAIAQGCRTMRMCEHPVCVCACFTWVKCSTRCAMSCMRLSPYVCVCGVLYKFHIYCQWQNMIRKLILLIK